MNKLEQHNCGANDKKYSELKENISVGIVTDDMMVELSKRAVSVCDTGNDD